MSKYNQSIFRKGSLRVPETIEIATCPRRQSVPKGIQKAQAAKKGTQTTYRTEAGNFQKDLTSQHAVIAVTSLRHIRICFSKTCF